MEGLSIDSWLCLNVRSGLISVMKPTGGVMKNLRVGSVSNVILFAAALLLLTSVSFCVSTNVVHTQSQQASGQQQRSIEAAATGSKHCVAQIKEGIEAGRKHGENSSTEDSLEDETSHSEKALRDCSEALKLLENKTYAQEDIQKALNYLQQAKHELEEAKHDKGGHRVASIISVNGAIRHLQFAMKAGSPLAVIKIFYATDRAQTRTTLISFGPERGDAQLRYGSFDVSIPRDHRFANIERPKIWRFEFGEDSEKHFVIINRAAEDEHSFFDKVSKAAQKSDERAVLIFIHGFNVSFEDAIYRTAQLTYDLGFSGVPILYSWPSNGELLEYTWDLTANDWTVPHLERFLELIAQRSKAKVVHIIAHSMGNRALIQALSSMKKTGSPRFNEIALTAPDIDADIFVQLSAALKGHANHITLYVSSNDRALKASKRINGGRRAGDSDGEILILNGIDTVDASAVDTDLIGHFYYGDNKSVVTDMFYLIRGVEPPSNRAAMRTEGTPPRRFWRFAP
jgi:esterase/lipase superfamily enzyme